MVSPKKKLARIRNWSELPSELLELIIKKLVVVDTIRFKSVCRYWNKAARSTISSPSYIPKPQIPLLMLSTKPTMDQLHGCRFLNLEENGKVYILNNDDVYGGFSDDALYAGSSYGWLAILDKKTEPYLVNPFSRAKIKFQLEPTTRLRFEKDLVVKIVLSSNPSRNKNFSAAVLCGIVPTNSRLAFYEHSDNTDSFTWTWSELENEFYSDITCHNGKIYALNFFNSVHIWDFHTSVPIKVVDTINVKMEAKKLAMGLLRYPMPMPDNLSSFYRPCLVESSSGEILILKQIRLYSVDNDTMSTIGFLVFKFDDETGKIECTPQTLSDQAILLGRREATSISTRDFPELEANSIYFMDEYLEIYNLKEDKFTSCVYEYGLSTKSLSCWMVPNLW